MSCVVNVFEISHRLTHSVPECDVLNKLALYTSHHPPPRLTANLTCLPAPGRCTKVADYFPGTGV